MTDRIILGIAAVESFVASVLVFGSIHDAVLDLTPGELACLSAANQRADADRCFDRPPWYAADVFVSTMVTTILATLLVWLALRWERRRR